MCLRACAHVGKDRPDIRVPRTGTRLGANVRIGICYDRIKCFWGEEKAQQFESLASLTADREGWCWAESLSDQENTVPKCLWGTVGKSRHA